METRTGRALLRKPAASEGRESLERALNDRPNPIDTGHDKARSAYFIHPILLYNTKQEFNLIPYRNSRPISWYPYHFFKGYFHDFYRPVDHPKNNFFNSKTIQTGKNTNLAYYFP